MQDGFANQTLGTIYVVQDETPGPLTAFGSLISSGGLSLRVEVFDGNRLAGTETVFETRWGVRTAASPQITGFSYDRRLPGATFIEFDFERPSMPMTHQPSVRSLPPRALAPVCGNLYLQVIDRSTCPISPVVRLP
ncbi:MAG: hypothetical protein ACOC0P_06155 [Planctomycetota bacterium]